MHQKFNACILEPVRVYVLRALFMKYTAKQCSCFISLIYSLGGGIDVGKAPCPPLGQCFISLIYSLGGGIDVGKAPTWGSDHESTMSTTHLRKGCAKSLQPCAATLRRASRRRTFAIMVAVSWKFLQDSICDFERNSSHILIPML